MGVRLVKYNTTSGGSSGTFDHNLLENRDMADQHPITAISGLEERLQEMMSEVEVMLGNIKQTLKDLEDTTIVDEKTGQIIIYNSSTNTWENKDYIQQQDLPYPCSDISGQILQYIGENKKYSQLNFSLDIVNGYFYKCILDEDNTSIRIPDMAGSGNWWSPVYSYAQDFTVSVDMTWGNIYIDGSLYYYGGATYSNHLTFVLKAGQRLQFNLGNSNYARNIILTGTLYKWIRINVQPSEIDDINTSETSTYSSTKIEDLLNNLQGKLKLSELSDTVITDPQKSDIIMYNSDTEQWENKPNNISLFYNDAGYIARHITAKEMQTIWDDVEIDY